MLYTLIGEPTLDEQAKLFVAALDLGSVSALGPPSPRIINATTRISRRSIAAICGTPSTKICSHSKYIAIQLLCDWSSKSHINISTYAFVFPEHFL